MESYNTEKRKSRNQKFYEYFITLQKEFIVAELRKKIYPDTTGKAKSEEIMIGKRTKVFDMSIKNSMGTIFPDMFIGSKSLYDEKLRIQLYREIYNEFGLPNFIYRDKIQEEKLGLKDRNCYWMFGSEIATRDKKVGSLQSIDFNKNIGFVKVGGQIIEYSLLDIKRIL